MDSEAAQATAHERYRIVRRGSRWSVRIAIEDEWAPLYAIDDEPPAPIDYEDANWYTATHPDSHFRHELIAARTAPAARLALRDNRLPLPPPSGTSERPYPTPNWLPANPPTPIPAPVAP